MCSIPACCSATGLTRPAKATGRPGHLKTELAERLGAGYSHLCSSGTAALSIALNACGVGTGDEVVVPPFTFVATFEAVLQAGAIPVFAEVDDTLCLDPAALAQVISPRTRAVIPVHMCGAAARIDEIKTICDRHGLFLIEDACQALGGSLNGKALGTFGHVGCFSFDAVKTITCGEGGGIVTNDRDLYVRADAYADHGHDHVGNDRGLEKHLILGSNYRISELNAAVGLAQLRKLDDILDRQRNHKKILKTAMAALPGVTFRRILDADGDSATFLSFFLPDRDRARKVAAELGPAGVDGCFYWFDNNWHYLRQWDHLKKMMSAARLPVQLSDHLPDYENLVLPRSDDIVGRTISMQIKLSWTAADLEQRIAALKTIFKARGI